MKETLADVLNKLAQYEYAEPGSITVTHCGDQLGNWCASCTPSEMLETVDVYADVPARKIGDSIEIGTGYGWMPEFYITESED